MAMYPGSFIWRFLSEDWLVGKRAAVLFGFFLAVIVGMTAALYNSERIPQAGVLGTSLWAVGGVLAGLGIFFLWGGMWRYWIDCDPSSRAARRFWFLVLLLGIWYGAVLYYALVYLPNTRRSGGKAAGGPVK